jgi:putative regulator of septum formation
MVAPTGVNTEIHHDGVNPETAPFEPAGEGIQDAAPPEGGTAEAGAGLDPEPAEAELAQAETAEAEMAEAERARGRDGRDVSPWAVAAIILIVIVLVGVAVGVLAVLTHGFHKKTLVTYRPAAVFKLRPGECINSAPDGLAVTVLSCGTPHQAEVFATFTLPKSSWPGSAAAEQDAGDGCASRLGAYLNPDLANAGLAQEFVYPNQAAWQAGERTVVCEVSSSTGKLTGSVRKAS